MTGKDAIRFFGWVIALCIIDAMATLIFHRHGDFDRNAAWAGFMTILSAIRDQQEGAA